MNESRNESGGKARWAAWRRNGLEFVARSYHFEDERRLFVIRGVGVWGLNWFINGGSNMWVAVLLVVAPANVTGGGRFEVRRGKN